MMLSQILKFVSMMCHMVACTTIKIPVIVLHRFLCFQEYIVWPLFVTISWLVLSLISFVKPIKILHCCVANFGRNLTFWFWVSAASSASSPTSKVRASPITTGAKLVAFPIYFMINFFGQVWWGIDAYIVETI